MRVFVVGTGRCGTVTFARACQHISNYTSAHESRISEIEGRLDYPDNHIEVDHRLAWHLGSLLRRYPDAVYVHLTRDREKVVQSWAKRLTVRGGMLPAFMNGILFRPPPDAEAAVRLMVDTVIDNIEAILPDCLTIPIEDPHEPFDELWHQVGAQGDQEAAHAALGEVHNGG